MGQKVVDALKTEIDKLKTDKIRDFVKKVLLEEVYDTNAEGPASSSGKYHPKCDLGEGGLVRHTKIVCRNVETLMQAVPLYDDDENWDAVYAAAILHDMCKFREDLAHSWLSHPIDMSSIIRRLNVTADKTIERIASNVETHMSRFTTSGTESPLPLPKNPENMLIPYADMIASRKWFYAKFDENGDLVQDPYED